MLRNFDLGNQEKDVILFAEIKKFTLQLKMAGSSPHRQCFGVVAGVYVQIVCERTCEINRMGEIKLFYFYMLRQNC